LPGGDGETIRLQSARLSSFRALRTVVAVYLLEHYPVPRPQGLLGHQHLTRLLAQIRRVLGAAPRQPFATFRLAAAGRDSAVFRRLAGEIAAATGLRFDPDEGDLLLRIRPAEWQAEGWEVLSRLTPRPLSARAWRVCNLPGGLNATLAAAMVQAAGVTASDRLCDPMCGSGTLLIERLLAGPAASALACDLSPTALACCRDNLQAAELSDRVTLAQADASRLNVAEASFDLVLCNPPWGDAVGAHGHNQTLYPALLTELARITAPGGRLVLLSHEVKLLQRLLDNTPQWRVQHSTRVYHGGHYPRFYLLTRTPASLAAAPTL
jgi:ubiquinone/menaquinone biosynthesis C-methylase UbiE